MSQHILTGNGAPAITPTKLGQHYIDIQNKNAYVSAGTDSSADWKIAVALSTEQIQDAIGGMFVGTSPISVSYDDPSNQIITSINQSTIDHTLIANKGTNTHDQIDSHVASTSNPHSVTKTQIGLANVDNTSDINKPISTATQVALNAKYDASNPNSYETPAQLNTRDTNNRARANHTGTQLAATISDLAAGVRATVMTGMVFNNLNPVTALDTLITAISKLQAQIDQINFTNANTQESMLVVDYTNSSSTTIVQIPEMGCVVNGGMYYFIRATVRFRTANTSTGFAISIGTSNGVTGTLSCHVEMTQAADAVGASFHGSITALDDFVTSTAVLAANTDYICKIEGTLICTGGGTIVPEFRSEVNGSTATFRAGSYISVQEHNA